MQTIDLSKRVQTKFGKEVKIYCFYPIQGEIHGAYRQGPVNDGYWVPMVWSTYGACIPSWKSNQGMEDLVNVPEKRICFMNVNVDSYTVHDTRIDADNWATTQRIACKRIEVTEGEGL